MCPNFGRHRTNARRNRPTLVDSRPDIAEHRTTIKHRSNPAQCWSNLSGSNWADFAPSYPIEGQHRSDFDRGRSMFDQLRPGFARSLAISTGISSSWAEPGLHSRTLDCRRPRMRIGDKGGTSPRRAAEGRSNVELRSRNTVFLHHIRPRSENLHDLMWRIRKARHHRPSAACRSGSGPRAMGWGRQEGNERGSGAARDGPPSHSLALAVVWATPLS